MEIKESSMKEIKLYIVRCPICDSNIQTLGEELQHTKQIACSECLQVFNIEHDLCGIDKIPYHKPVLVVVWMVVRKDIFEFYRTYEGAVEATKDEKAGKSIYRFVGSVPYGYVYNGGYKIVK